MQYYSNEPNCDHNNEYNETYDLRRPNFKPEFYHAITPTTYSQMKDQMHYLWLKNGSEFWFYCAFYYDDILYGYYFDNNLWKKTSINTYMVKAVY